MDFNVETIVESLVLLLWLLRQLISVLRELMLLLQQLRNIVTVCISSSD